MAFTPRQSTTNQLLEELWMLSFTSRKGNRTDTLSNKPTRFEPYAHRVLCWYGAHLDLGFFAALRWFMCWKHETAQLKLIKPAHTSFFFSIITSSANDNDRSILESIIGLSYSHPRGGARHEDKCFVFVRRTLIHSNNNKLRDTRKAAALLLSHFNRNNESHWHFIFLHNAQYKTLYIV